MIPPFVSPRWKGRFNTFQDWVDSAHYLLSEEAGRAEGCYSKAVCVDMKGRRCTIGADFMRARDEDAFPIFYFWMTEPSPATAEALCLQVAAVSQPEIATAWTCGLASIALLWTMRLHRVGHPVLMASEDHLWVENDGRWYDPTIGQFNEGSPVFGTLPHPLRQGKPVEPQP